MTTAQEKDTNFKQLYVCSPAAVCVGRKEEEEEREGREKTFPILLRARGEAEEERWKRDSRISSG